MKKLLSLVLTFTLLIITVSVAFTSALAESENLIKNGDFSEYSDYTPTNWQVKLADSATAEMIKDVEITDSVTANALKFTTSQDSTVRTDFYYTDTVQIEKNATYTTTFWVKAKNITGFRAYMYEPEYVDKNGATKTSTTAQEGQNIYSYSYESAYTRVCRTDVRHSWTIAESNTEIDSSTVSMFITRYKNVQTVISPDYPNEERAGEWVQIVHTFTTDNSSAHEADISYHFAFPQATDGELWIADIQMNVEKQTVDAYYTPAVNDDTLGCISPSGEQPLFAGEDVTFTAEPFGENIFDGWYNSNGECISTEKSLTFTYDPKNEPDYEAFFTKADYGIDGSFETGYTKGQLLSQAAHTKDASATDTDWSVTSFLSSEKENSGVYIDSTYGGTFRKASVSDTYSHSGQYSIDYSGSYGAVGYKYSGLEKNTTYALSVYAYLTSSGSTPWAGIDTVMVTSADESCIIKRSNGTYGYNNAGLYYNYDTALYENVTKEWTKIEVSVNTEDNEEVILWLSSSGNSAHLYLDDFAIARDINIYTPLVNDSTLGFVNTIEAKSGDTVTVTATALGENLFEGWYAGEKLISKQTDLTFTFSPAINPEYEARFSKGEYYIDGTYETGYTIDEAIASVAYTDKWTEETFLASSKDDVHYAEARSAGTWRKAYVTDSVSHTGSKSLCYFGSYSFIGRKITGLAANTNYTVGVYAYSTAINSSYTSVGISNIVVTDASSSILSSDSSGNISEKSLSDEGVLYKDSSSINTSAGWTYIPISFNTKDSTEVIVWLCSSTYTDKLYLDDFSVARSASADITRDRGGSITISRQDVVYNSVLTVTATPYDGNNFDGWYDTEDKLVSSDRSYTFNVTGDVKLHAKFSGDNMPKYDYFKDLGQDGTFENGTVEGWYADDPVYSYSVSWCSFERVDTNAYEGNYSLLSVSRFRDLVLPINNIYADTDYTLSMQLNLLAKDENANIEYVAVLDAENTHWYENDFAYAVVTDIKGEDWQKVELKFNSLSCTKLNLVIRYATDSAQGEDQLYIDNLALEVGEYNKLSDAPTIETVTSTSVTLTSTKGYEYSMDGITWQSSNVFEDLAPNTEYTFYQRFAATSTSPARATSSGKVVTTEKAFTAGDINDDGEIDLNDVVSLAQYVAGWKDVNVNVHSLNVNGDAAVDLNDVVLLAQYVAGWEGIELSDAPYTPTVG